MVFVLHGLDDFTVFKSGTRTLERIESIGSAVSERKHKSKFLKNESKCLLPKIVSVLTLRTIRQFVSLRTGEGSHLRTWLRTLNLLFRIRQTSTFLEVSGWKRLIAPSPNLSNWTAKNSVFWKNCGFLTDFYLSLNFNLNFAWFGGLLEYFHTTCRRSKRKFLELTWTNSSLVEWLKVAASYSFPEELHINIQRKYWWLKKWYTALQHLVSFPKSNSKCSST